ncbi:zf-HC2 domain-containing protein [Thermostaphylospora chromogena]|uniref:Putative zinc-finger n=1 Tax=Thermostaphylospora chromogena TaxID=35622 RepID=A0A1H1D5L1_9ACTN|nr:zf-HC2 domain-containing protein [Thermostaphylospora chromogena]SDQ71807.1 Putative zinc-finger [Thermostaphylospora chromogena]
MTAFSIIYERHVAAARALAVHLVAGSRRGAGERGRPAGAGGAAVPSAAATPGDVEEEAEEIVADAFAGILDAVRHGGGPADGFRLSLLAAVRRAAEARAAGMRTGSAASSPASRWEAGAVRAGGEDAAGDGGDGAAGETGPPNTVPFAVRTGRDPGYADTDLPEADIRRPEPEITPEDAPPGPGEVPGEAASSVLSAASPSSDASTATTAWGRSGMRRDDGTSSFAGGLYALLPEAERGAGGLARTPFALAFLSLPDRWRAVLWHVEVEAGRTAEIARLLGVSPAIVPAMADRAAEGLRQAYVRTRLGASPRRSCRPVLEKLGAYAGDGLTRREGGEIDRHLADCTDCRAAFHELADVGQGMRGTIGPLIVGPVLPAYLASLRQAAETARRGGIRGALTRLGRRDRRTASQTASWAAVAARTRAPRPSAVRRVTPTPEPEPGPLRWAAGVIRRHRFALAGTAFAVAVITAAAFILVSAERPTGRVAVGPPPVARTTPPVTSGPTPGRPTPPASPKPSAPPASRADTSTRGVPLESGDADVPEAGTPPAKVPASGTPKRARLVASIDPLGSLVRARPGIIGVRLRNVGAGPSGEVVATIKLPRGVSLLTSGRRGAGARTIEPVGTVDGWSCRPAEEGARCTRGPLAPGRDTAVFVRVLVDPRAPMGRVPGLRVSAGEERLSARARAGVREAGAPARFATDGRVVTRVIGNALLSCENDRVSCLVTGRGNGECRDNDLRRMKAIDADRDPRTSSSSAASLSIPSGGHVVWAGLYWSAANRARTTTTIKVRPPGRAGYIRVRATEVVTRELPVGSVYQAFADVTALAAAHGANGRWWVADAPMEEGASRYAGWSLVVIATAPGRPYARTVVLDPAAPVGNGHDVLTMPLSGLASMASPARIHLVTWEGDAGIKGDRVSLGGVVLRPVGGRRDARNAFEGTPVGAGGAKAALGLDMDLFKTVLSARPVLRVTSRKDVVLVGVVVASVRPRS